MNDSEKLQEIKNIIIQWNSKEGHERCWYYPDLFKEIALILNIEIKKGSLPSKTEFEEGCKKYQNEQFTE